MVGGAQMQTGVVVQFSPAGLFVSPGGEDAEPVPAGWLRGMYQPVLGETVALINQGASWLCLGPIHGPGSGHNTVRNYSFEESKPGVAPDGWTLVATAGSGTLSTVTWRHPEFVDGAQAASMTPGAVGLTTVQVLSHPIPIEKAGETWGLGAYYRPNHGFGANAGSARLYAAWYSGTELSSLISEESAVEYPLLRGLGWRLMTENGSTGRGSAAPPGVEYLRVKVVLSWTATASDVVYLDRVTARRTS